MVQASEICFQLPPSHRLNFLLYGTVESRQFTQ